ncbi:unnamed protein product [Clonostachys rosea f. rosea IK726]|jgi:HSP20 family molecular chaperone IbpA|uniref:SHSP domain-containing protein n=2 Tax=Bionectria ochroleuca TaxID=29856 RepID=A0A8H7KF02_BIOOC|nr:unnamed protein product [Clonostachys rosea f. rosea IK726]
MHVWEPTCGFFSRLLEDITYYPCGGDNTSTENDAITSLDPSFDVRELTDAYEVQGELHGLDRKDIKIEFVDSQTLIIHGKVERFYTLGGPPASIFASPSKSDVGTKKETHQGNAIAAVPWLKAKAVDGKDPNIWVVERSVEQFSDTFSFPHHIKQDGVVAILDGGSLNIRIPKSVNTQVH